MRFRQFCESVKWVQPDIKDEMDEFELHSKTLGLDLERLIESVKQGEVKVLDDETWAAMRNTDSWHGIQSGDLKSAIQYAKRYGKDVHSIIDAYKQGKDMPMPIVLMTGASPYLMAGNTRLMVARAMRDRPKVLLVYYK